MMIPITAEVVESLLICNKTAAISLCQAMAASFFALDNVVRPKFLSTISQLIGAPAALNSKPENSGSPWIKVVVHINN